MTPGAITPAGQETRDSRRTSPQDGAGSVPGHRRRSRASTATRPRRVSGPVSGRPDAGVRASAPVARSTTPSGPTFKRPPLASRIPRRVAGPVQGRFAPRLVAFVRALPDHQLLDRLIRGRTWIALLGVMLVGIVAMQVEVLKLSASIGRSIDRGTYLQGRNESLRASVAALADDQRIERLAVHRGMVMPSPSDVGFLSAGSGQAVQKAISNIHAPAPASFLTQTTGNGAVTTGANSTGPEAASTGANVTTAAAASPASAPSGASAPSSGDGSSGASSTSGASTSGASTSGASTSGASTSGASTSSSSSVSPSAVVPSTDAAALVGGGAAGGASGG